MALPEGKSAMAVELTLNNKLVDASLKNEGDKTIVIFESVVLLENDMITSIIKI